MSIVTVNYYYQGFLWAVYIWGGFVPHMGGTSAGGQSVNGWTHEGDIDLMGKGLTLINYIIN